MRTLIKKKKKAMKEEDNQGRTPLRWEMSHSHVLLFLQWIPDSLQIYLKLDMNSVLSNQSSLILLWVLFSLTFGKTMSKGLCLLVWGHNEDANRVESKICPDQNELRLKTFQGPWFWLRNERLEFQKELNRKKGSRKTSVRILLLPLSSYDIGH